MNSVRVDLDNTLEVRIDTLDTPKTEFDIVKRREMTF